MRIKNGLLAYYSAIDRNDHSNDADQVDQIMAILDEMLTLKQKRPVPRKVYALKSKKWIQDLELINQRSKVFQ